jgi:hypothetical protein
VRFKSERNELPADRAAERTPYARQCKGSTNTTKTENTGYFGQCQTISGTFGAFFFKAQHFVCLLTGTTGGVQPTDSRTSFAISQAYDWIAWEAEVRIARFDAQLDGPDLPHELGLPRGRGASE